jgi:hypothetical protein
MLDSRGLEHTESKGGFVLSGEWRQYAVIRRVSRSAHKLPIAYARLPQKTDPLSTRQHPWGAQGAGSPLGSTHWSEYTGPSTR